MRDPLDDALGLPPMERREVEAYVPQDRTGDDDFDRARDSLYRLAAKAEAHLDELGEIASISQHARAYEVYSNLLKTTIDANKDILGLRKSLRDGEASDQGPRTVNQTLIATSDEILRMIKEGKE